MPEKKKEQQDLRGMTNEQLHEHAVRMDSLTLLELELTLRLEAYIQLYGDYLEV